MIFHHVAVQLINEKPDPANIFQDTILIELTLDSSRIVIFIWQDISIKIWYAI